MFKGRVKMYTGVTVRQPQLPPPLPPLALLHLQGGRGGVDKGGEGWESGSEDESVMRVGGNDDFTRVGKRYERWEGGGVT